MSYGTQLANTGAEKDEGRRNKNLQDPQPPLQREKN